MQTDTSSTGRVTGGNLTLFLQESILGGISFFYFFDAPVDTTVVTI